MVNSGPAVPLGGCLTGPIAPDRLIPGCGPELALVGLADDSRSSHASGCAAAPAAIRAAYDGACHNSFSEYGPIGPARLGLDLTGAAADLGDFTAPDWTEAAALFESVCRRVIQAGKIPFFLGGDHAVTIPAAAGLAALNRPVQVIQLDAHPDLYPDYDGDQFSHACTAARLLEMDHIAGLTQIGVRTMNRVQAEAVDRAGERIRIVPAAELALGSDLFALIKPDDAVYITVDMDALDPAFAPGVNHPTPGGLTSRQILDIIRTVPGRLVGLDVVEVNPARDVAGLTALTAGRLLVHGFARALAGQA